MGNSIRRFEEIIAWQKARLLVTEIYVLTRMDHVVRDLRYCSQIQAASVSCMSNIAEGFERATNKELRQFLFIASGSCAEVRSLLYVGRDLNYLDQQQFEGLYARSEEVSRLIKGFRSSLKME